LGRSVAGIAVTVPAADLSRLLSDVAGGALLGFDGAGRWGRSLDPHLGFVKIVDIRV